MHFLNSAWFPIALVWRVHKEMRPASTSSNCLTDSRVVLWVSVHQSYCCLHSAGGGFLQKQQDRDKRQKENYEYYFRHGATGSNDLPDDGLVHKYMLCLVKSEVCNSCTSSVSTVIEVFGSAPICHWLQIGLAPKSHLVYQCLPHFFSGAGSGSLFLFIFPIGI